MTLEDQLKKEILSRYKSIREYSSMTEIPYSTIDSVLKRGIKNSGVGTVIKIFSYLDIDVESITSGTLKHLDSLKRIEKAPLYSSEAMKLAADYDGLDEWGKRQLRSVADNEIARCSAIEKGPPELDIATEVASYKAELELQKEAEEKSSVSDGYSGTGGAKMA